MTTMTVAQQACYKLLKENPEKIWESREVFDAFCFNVIRILDQYEQIIPFVPNETQNVIINEYLRQRGSKKPARVIVGKGRQQGSSEGVAVLCFVEMLTRPNLQALVCSEVASASGENIFRKYVRYLEHLPWFPEDMPPKDRCIKFNSDDQFVLENKSSITLRGQSDVTSWTFQFAHFSEASRFHNFQKFLGVASAAFASIPSTSIFIESTAKDWGDGYHKEYERAKSGESDFKNIFIGWHLHGENKMEFENNKEKEKFLKSLGTDITKYGDEIAIQQELNLTDEQMYWRRDTIRNRCQGKLATFKREFPSNDVEMFMSTDRPAFCQESLIHMLDNVRPPMLKGFMEPDIAAGEREDGTQTAEFTENEDGAITIQEQPLPFEEYIASSDHSEGILTGDYNVGLIAKRSTFEIVAMIRGERRTKLQTVNFARQLYYLMRWYNISKWFGENNLQGQVVVRELEDWGYPGLLYESDILTDTASERIGWLNTSKTAKQFSDLAINAMSLDFSGDAPRVVSDITPIIYDEYILREFQFMVWDKKKIRAKYKGEMCAEGESEAGYYDDCVYAMLGLFAIQKYLGPLKSESERMLQQLGPNHALTEHLPQHLRDRYTDPSQLPANENSWMELG